MPKKFIPHAIVFDFDGILVDSEPVHYSALTEILKSEFSISYSWEQYQAQALGLEDFEVFEKLLPHLDETEIQKAVQKKANAFERLVPLRSRFQPGVPELLNRLDNLKIPFAIASGALKRDIKAVLKSLGGETLLNRFKTIASADEVEHSKPDPETYLLACSRMNWVPSSCLSFEDTTFGIRAAKGAGLICVGVTHSMPRSKLEPLADKVIDTFVGLDPHNIFET